MAGVWGAELILLRCICATQRNHQMIAVLLSVAAAVLLTLVLYKLCIRKDIQRIKPENTQRKPIHIILIVAVFLCGVAANVDRMVTEASSMEMFYGYTGLLWNNIPFSATFFTCLIAFLGGVFQLYREIRQSSEDRADRLVTMVVYLFTVVVYALSCYVPNMFNIDQHHLTASLTSIYNTAFDVPFNFRTSGIYGHYAIFFWPFLKLLGHRPRTIAFLISGAAAVTELLLIYAIDRSVKSETLRRVAALASALPIAVMYIAPYLQTYPLRILPAVLILAYCTYCDTREKPISDARLILGYVVCAVAITWVTDAGIVATVAYSAWVCFKNWQSEKIFSVSSMKVYAKCIVGCIGAVAGMVLIINFYNVVICRGEIVFRACFFPFIGAESFAGLLWLPLNWMNISWVWCLACLFVSGVIALTGIKCLNPEVDSCSWKSLMFLSAIMGLGQSGYYFNRAAYYNLTVVMPEAILCMAFFVEACKNSIKDTGKNLWSWGRAVFTGAGLVVLFEMAALAAALVMTCSATFKTRVDRDFYDMTYLDILVEEVEAKVPENTYAVGVGTQEVYAELGWNPGYLQRDVSDFFGAGIEEIIADIESQNTVLFGPMSYERGEEWQVLAMIPEDNPVFYYCVKEGD